jgi:hypothetical protein
MPRKQVLLSKNVQRGIGNMHYTKYYIKRRWNGPYCSECGANLRYGDHLYRCSQYVSFRVWTGPNITWYHVSDPPKIRKLKKKRSNRDW